MTIRAVAVASFFLALAGLLAGAPIAWAGEAAQQTRQALEAGDLAAAEAKLGARVESDPRDDEARLGLGMIRFAGAIERFLQAQYRYGLNPIGRDLPIGVALNPLPINPAPAQLRYEDQRATLQALLDDLQKVDATLAPIGQSDAKIALNLYAIRINVTGTSPSDPNSTLGALIAAFGAPPGAPPETDRQTFDAVFDRADALWLRGYAQAISAGLEFALAYDWRESFDRYAFLLYPQAKPATDRPSPPTARRQPTVMQGEERILDMIGFIHSIHWRCIEPERMGKARDHFKSVVALNRAMWPIVLARHDEERHWISGPQQANPALPSLKLTPEKLKAWRSAVDMFDALLDGAKLAPFWRYDLGLDVRAFFEKPADFDFVYWIIGPGAVPYLREGPTITRKEWTDMQGVFGGNFLSYLVWLN